MAAPPSRGLRPRLLPRESIASVFDLRRLTPADLPDTLPEARGRIFARCYPELAGQAAPSRSQ